MSYFDAYLEYERDCREWYEPDLRRRLSTGERRLSGDLPLLSPRLSLFLDDDRSFFPTIQQKKIIEVKKKFTKL